MRNSFEEQIRTFLIYHPSREEHHRIHWTNVVVPLHFSRINSYVIVSDADSVVNCGQLPVRNLVHPHDLVPQVVGNRYYSIRPITSRPFLFADPGVLLSTPEIIPAAPVFSRMSGQDAFAAPSLLDLDHRIAGEPIMRVNDVKWADVVLGLEDIVNE